MSEPIKLDIGKEDIIDWCDGVLSALLDFGEDAPPRLCLCIAWSPEYDERIWAGQRSIRLSRSYRAIYEIKAGVAEFVSVEEVSKHEY